MQEKINKYYLDQASGTFHGPEIQAGYGQKGAGFGKWLNKFMRYITPLAQKYVIPHLESGAKAVGKQLVHSVSGMVSDAIDGKELKEAANERFHEVVDSLKSKADDVLAGRGTSINKRKKNKNYVILKNTKKSRTRDIFDK